MSTPVVTPDSTTDLHFISQDPEYRKTGVLPQAVSTPAKEPSEPEKVDATVDADVDHEGESAAVPETAVQEPKKRNAETRIRELVAQTKRLEAQLDEARRPKETKAESSPAPEKQPEIKADAAPVKPKQDDFKTWEEFDAARDDYHEKMADYKAQQAVKTYEASRAQREQQVKLEQQMREVKEKYPEFDDVAIPFGMEIGKDPAIHQAVKKRISDSNVLPELLMVMAGADEAKRQEFLKLSKTDPVAALGEIAVFEYLIKEKLTESKPKAPEKQAPKAPPEPATEVSGKSGAPVDEVEAATRANDGSPDSFARYKAAANRRDLERARKKG